MKRFYLTTNQFSNRLIDGDEFNHMKNVMRMNEGDEFIAFIGDEYDFICSIDEIKKNYLTFKTHTSVKNTKNPKIQIDLFQALAKGEKMELISQKCTEIGISSIYPLYVKNCDVKPNTNKPTRIEKIIVSACKQCGRSTLPTVHQVIKLDDAINLLHSYDLVLFANETEESTRIYDSLNRKPNAHKIALIVGPEGGFTQEEISKLKSVSTSVSLGARILRTETASIYLASIISDFYGN